MKLGIYIMLALLVMPVMALNGDQALFDKIVGVWWSRVSNGDIAVEATEDCRSDGTIITNGDVYSKGLLVEQYQIKSTWKIEDGYSIVEVTESSNEKVVAVGTKIIDRIISVDEKEFIYEAADGRKQTLTRIK
jgi:hypothetical protein